MQWSRAIVKEFAMVRRVCLNRIGSKFFWLSTSHLLYHYYLSDRWHKMWECARYFLELAISCGLRIFQANLHPIWRSIWLFILLRHWRKAKMLSSTWSKFLNPNYSKFICSFFCFSCEKVGGAVVKIAKTLTVHSLSQPIYFPFILFFLWMQITLVHICVFFV
jgi:hypothetical protein